MGVGDEAGTRGVHLSATAKLVKVKILQDSDGAHVSLRSLQGIAIAQHGDIAFVTDEASRDILQMRFIRPLEVAVKRIYHFENCNSEPRGVCGSL